MSESKLGRKIAAARQDEARSEQRRQAAQRTQQEREARKQSRLESFTDLAERYEKVRARSMNIIDRGNSLMSPYYSPWIILEPSTDDEPFAVFGHIRIYEEVRLGIYTANKKIEQGVRNGEITPHGQEQPAYNRLGYVDGYEYDGFTAVTEEINSYDKYRGGVYQFVYDRTSGGRFSPVNALYRYRLQTKASAQVENLEQMLDLFESAMDDPELNPHLVKTESETA